MDFESNYCLCISALDFKNIQTLQTNKQTMEKNDDLTKQTHEMHRFKITQSRLTTSGLQSENKNKGETRGINFSSNSGTGK